MAFINCLPCFMGEHPFCGKSHETGPCSLSRSAGFQGTGWNQGGNGMFVDHLLLVVRDKDHHKVVKSGDDPRSWNPFMRNRVTGRRSFRTWRSRASCKFMASDISIPSFCWDTSILSPGLSKKGISAAACSKSWGKSWPAAGAANGWLCFSGTR